MAIEILANGEYAPNLKFKDLLKKDYLIVSKKFDEPLTYPSKYCPNTDGKSYKFALDLHEYSYMNEDEERVTVKESQEVGYWQADTEYEQKDGSWKQTQGTILKALNAAEVGEHLKITMAENDKGKKVYTVVTVTPSKSEEPATPKIKTGTPDVNETLTYIQAIEQAKKAGKTLEQTCEEVCPAFGITAAQVTNRWEVI